MPTDNAGRDTQIVWAYHGRELHLTDGLAHVGMLPDFIADLETLGLNERDLEPLLKSAEGYIRVWERALAVRVPSS